jgi:hypothetical protein
VFADEHLFGSRPADGAFARARKRTRLRWSAIATTDIICESAASAVAILDQSAARIFHTERDCGA